MGYEKNFVCILDFWSRRWGGTADVCAAFDGKSPRRKIPHADEKVDALKKKRYCVGGMVGQETCEEGMRVDFEILNLSHGRGGKVAHVN